MLGFDALAGLLVVAAQGAGRPVVELLGSVLGAAFLVGSAGASDVFAGSSS